MLPEEIPSNILCQIFVGLFFSIIYWTAIVYKAHYEYSTEGEFLAKLLGTRVQNDPPFYCFSNWNRAENEYNQSVGSQFLLNLRKSSWRKLKEWWKVFKKQRGMKDATVGGGGAGGGTLNGERQIAKNENEP